MESEEYESGGGKTEGREEVKWKVAGMDVHLERNETETDAEPTM